MEQDRHEEDPMKSAKGQMKSAQGHEGPRIVVGVDGFESSNAALRWAIHHAKLTGAVVEAVTAWHVPVGTGWMPTADMPDYQDDARAVLGEAIAEMCAVDPDVQVFARVVEGHAGQVLVDAAEGADLLVVGCRGHGGLTEALLGSVGQYCVHHAPCPVVIMRGKH
jgi:nucleotide-binding universal stress UspA family protein